MIQRAARGQVRVKFELEVLKGLEPFAAEEIRHVTGVRVQRSAPGRVALETSNKLDSLTSIKTAVAVHRVLNVNSRSPRAILGNEAFTLLVNVCQELIARYPGGAFRTFRISAAGSDTRVFQRLRHDLGSALRLSEVEEKTNLLITVRRTPCSEVGWDVLIRLSPRPLSARSWRVCNYRAALDATIARAMIMMCSAGGGKRFLNLACGSGTLLIERLSIGTTVDAVGIDNDSDALDCARRNLDAAGLTGRCTLLHRDATETGLDDGVFDDIVADLPWGMASDQISDLESFYDGVLSESGRLAAPLANLLLVTTRRRLLLGRLDRFASKWEQLQSFQVSIPAGRGYIHPTVFHLRHLG